MFSRGPRASGSSTSAFEAFGKARGARIRSGPYYQCFEAEMLTNRPIAE
jgi:hypothetical protein